MSTSIKYKALEINTCELFHRPKEWSDMLPRSNWNFKSYM